MFQLRVTVDSAAFRRSAQTRFKDLRSALDDAVLYLANSARERLSEATRQVFEGRRGYSVTSCSVAGDDRSPPSTRPAT